MGCRRKGLPYQVVPVCRAVGRQELWHSRAGPERSIALAGRDLLAAGRSSVVVDCFVDVGLGRKTLSLASVGPKLVEARRGRRLVGLLSDRAASSVEVAQRDHPRPGLEPRRDLHLVPQHSGRALPFQRVIILKLQKKKISLVIS